MQDNSVWHDILKAQPAEGQRVLMKFSDNKVRIGDYSRFDYRQWAITYWKPMPQCMDNR